MILRLILAFLIIALIITLIKRFSRKRRNNSKPRNPDEYKDTVRCHTCGIRLPKNEAIEQDGQFYCCKDHIES